MELGIVRDDKRFRCKDVGFEVLYHRAQPLAYSVALRLTRNCDDAQDVAQEVLCKLWAGQSLVRFEYFENWLRVVTKNAATDLLRRRVRERRYTASGISGVHAESAEEETLRGFEAARLVRALEQLETDSRGLLLESFVDEQPHAAIARRRATPLGTVKSRIRAGLKKLNRFMAS